MTKSGANNEGAGRSARRLFALRPMSPVGLEVMGMAIVLMQVALDGLRLHRLAGCGGRLVSRGGEARLSHPGPRDKKGECEKNGVFHVMLHVGLRLSAPIRTSSHGRTEPPLKPIFICGS